MIQTFMKKASRNKVETQTEKGLRTRNEQWLNDDVEGRAPRSKPRHKIDQHEVHLQVEIIELGGENDSLMSVQVNDIADL